MVPLVVVDGAADCGSLDEVIDELIEVAIDSVVFVLVSPLVVAVTWDVMLDADVPSDDVDVRDGDVVVVRTAEEASVPVEVVATCCKHQSLSHAQRQGQ